MKYSYYDLGYLVKGQIIKVNLSAAANVKLLDASNYKHYKKGKKHRYYGGYVTKVPYTISVPKDGHWYVTVDLGGYTGKVGHSVKVMPGNLL